MPIQVCYVNGKPGFKWGPDGKCYTYPKDSDAAKKKARNRARKQGVAAIISGFEFVKHTCGDTCGHHDFGMMEFRKTPPVHPNCACEIVDGHWDTHPELTASGVCPICQGLSQKYNARETAKRHGPQSKK
jgi:hypothetical protein